MFQYLATCFVVTVKNIFSSLTTIINHIKGNYHDHVQAGRVKRLLQELQEAENTKIQYDWISEHRQETRQANKIIQRQIHLSVTYSQFEIQVQSKTPPKPSTIKKIRNCDIELKLLNIEYFQHLELETELMNRKPSGHLVHRFGVLNGPTANFAAAAALVIVVAVNDLGSRFGILLERFDICTAQEVVDATPATAVTPQVWQSNEGPRSNLKKLLVKIGCGAISERAVSFTGLDLGLGIGEVKMNGSGDWSCRMISGLGFLKAQCVC